MRHLIAATVLLLSSGSALAQTPAEDVKCLVASNIFANTEKDAAKRQVSTAARLFYLGRVDARLGGGQLQTTLTTAAKGITAANVGATMTTCVKSMQGKLAALQALSQQAARSK
jgi:hypothetical protein